MWQGKSLKQELQRQQKALAAGQERESMLSAKLSEKDAALRALEEGPRQEPVRYFALRADFPCL